MVECATADGFAAQALGAVEAEVAFELGQFKFWITDFQAGLVGVEIHHDFRLFAMLQRDVEINAALERALALPAGKGRLSANRRFLQDFQAIAQTAVEVTVQKQVRDFASVDVRDIDRDVAHFGVEQQAFAGHDPHTAVFDKHVTGDIAHMWPARLERQLSAMHLEEQADVTRRVHGIVVQ